MRKQIYKCSYIPFIFSCLMCIVCFCLFFSCTPDAVPVYDIYTEVTLRSAASASTEAVDWIISEHTVQDGEQSGQKQLRLPPGSSENPEALFIADMSFGTEIRPIVEGLGYSDTTVLPSAVCVFAHAVLQGCKKRELRADFFSESRLFLKTIAEYELRRLPDIQDMEAGCARIDESGIFEIPVRCITPDGFFTIGIYIYEESAGAFKVEQLIFGEVQK